MHALTAQQLCDDMVRTVVNNLVELCWHRGHGSPSSGVQGAALQGLSSTGAPGGHGWFLGHDQLPCDCDEQLNEQFSTLLQELLFYWHVRRAYFPTVSSAISSRAALLCSFKARAMIPHNAVTSYSTLVSIAASLRYKMR